MIYGDELVPSNYDTRKRDTRLILLRPALLGCCVSYGRYLCAGVICRHMTAHKLGGGVPNF